MKNVIYSVILIMKYLKKSCLRKFIVSFFFFFFKLLHNIGWSNHANSHVPIRSGEPLKADVLIIWSLGVTECYFPFKLP